jgi:putative DNA methylase
MIKKLIEVAIPLEVINKAAIREKSIRHGHPSTLHLYWARRPLATCRAILFAQLVDDPSSHPDKFPTEKEIELERSRLFSIIEDLVQWENSTNNEILSKARKEILKSCGGKLPPIFDPFSGGASIPFEAQRLGLPAHGSDLNPIAVAIGKAMIELPPKFKNCEPIHPGIKDQSFYRNLEGLAEDVKFYGEWIRNAAKKNIGHLYPLVDLPNKYGGGKSVVVSWIWARTVPSPDPAFADVHVPLMTNFVLSSKKGKEVWIEPVLDKINKTIKYNIQNLGTEEDISKASQGTAAGKRNGFRCLFSATPISYEYIRRVGKSGGIKTQLMAVVAQGKNQRIFLPPDEKQHHAPTLAEPNTLNDIPLPNNTRDFKTPNYGVSNFSELFTNRQLCALQTFSQLILEAQDKIKKDIISNVKTSGRDQDEINEYAAAVSLYLTFGLSRLADISNAYCVWSTSANQAVHLFGRQAIPMVWSFAETGLFSDMAGDYRTSLNSVIKVILRFLPNAEGSQIQHDAQTRKYPNHAVISTDPPYYDNIGYADLSDFFYLWLKPILKKTYPEIFSLLATPKQDELVADPYRHGTKAKAEKFFLEGMQRAMKQCAQSSSKQFPTTIYYAFKQSEVAKEGVSSTGWATFLTAVLNSGFAVVGTWPVRTERDTGLKIGMNVLANSVVLVCRQKDKSAKSITRAEFLRALKSELPPAISKLQSANVSPADMPQSAIGPGIGIFSRYNNVLESDDTNMSVKTALQLINSELDEFLNNLHGEFDPETRFTASWYEQNGYDKGDFGAANNLATARGLAVESVRNAGIVESSAGKVRIFKRDELDPNWDPNSDTNLTVWECCQYLVRDYENGGETAAAMLVKKMGFEKAEAVKDLAYYLYDICSNKRQDAKESASYNALITGWNDIMRMANSIKDTDTTSQASLF